MDVMAMSFESDSYDAVIDKGTLDSLLVILHICFYCSVWEKLCNQWLKGDKLNLSSSET